jgi:hypothetical protein
MRHGHSDGPDVMINIRFPMHAHATLLAPLWHVYTMLNKADPAGKPVGLYGGGDFLDSAPAPGQLRSSSPDLLAAGGAARGVSGQAVWGYLSGNGLLSAIAGGHMAAHTAQQLLKDTP